MTEVIPGVGFLRRVLAGSVNLAAGVAATLVLFGSMARIERADAPVAEPQTEDLRVYSAPMDLPPPRPPERTQVVAAGPATPSLGIDPGPSDSPVKIAVMPPDLLDVLAPDASAAPPAKIEFSTSFAEFKPKTDIVQEANHIFQQHEVDRVPTILYRPDPRVPSWVRGRASVLWVTLIVVVDSHGKVSSVRFARSSGNPQFDKIISESVLHEWGFTPAVKNGRNVACLLQQAITVRWEGSKPFGY